jgi:hypothetical protein
MGWSSSKSDNPGLRSVSKRHLKWRAGNSENMIRKLKSGEYRLYSRKKNPKTGKRRNLGTFASLEKAKAHERAVQFFKRH